MDVHWLTKTYLVVTLFPEVDEKILGNKVNKDDLDEFFDLNLSSMIVQCTYMYIVHCTLYTVHCTLYTVHCTLYTVHCTLYRYVSYNQQRYNKDLP